MPVLAKRAVARNMSLMQRPVPTELWAELKRDGLLARDAPTACLD